ncbi:MAG: glycosyltransferase [Thermodesulfobacteriota bacterium]|nr:glycosyltransferase [Thermodesulfobacteriota bacterium]
MSKQKDMKSSYASRKLNFLNHHNGLLKIANSEIEQKLWSNELLLFHKNYVISNQTQEIKELKRAIGELEGANSVRLARLIKSRLSGWFPRKKSKDGDKSKPYDLEKIIMAMEEQVKKVGNNENSSKFDRLWVNQLPDRNLLEQYKNELREGLNTPKISIILPVYNVEDKWLTQAIESVLGQIYKNWELCIVDDASTNTGIPEILDRFAEMDSRIKVKYNKKNSGISQTSNNALAMTTGEYVTFLDHDDYLSPNALFEVHQTIKETQADFIYSDEALVNPLNKIVNILFKPDFSPDFLLSLNYINHLMVIHKELIEKSGGFRDGIEGAQDYDIALKTSEIADKIHHIHKVLYFWRLSSGTFSATMTNKRKIHNAGQRAIEEALNRRNIDAEVYQSKRIYNYQVKRNIKNKYRISIIIPFKDKADILSTCLESIIFNTSYTNYEIIGISNNSEKSETFETMRTFEALDERIQFYEYDLPFNYSKINNYGVTKATGEHVVLMNNDIEMINYGWIEALLQHSQRDEVGAVGGKLYYPNNTIQHAGVILGISGFAGHSHRHFPKESDGSMNRVVNIHNVSAVTGALLMVKKTLYLEVGGLDEDNLQVALNDIDFCLKIREKGYVNIFTPYCEAYHHESMTRGYDTTMEQKRKFEQERNFFIKKWTDILQKDPYYNKNLTLEREDFSQRSEQEQIKDITAPFLFK